GLTGARTARGLPGAPADGVLGAVPDRRLGLPGTARRPRQDQTQRRLPGLRTRDVDGPGLRLPLRFPRPAPPRGPARPARARIRPRPHLHGTDRDLRGYHGGRDRDDDDEPELIPYRIDQGGQEGHGPGDYLR